MLKDVALDGSIRCEHKKQKLKKSAKKVMIQKDLKIQESTDLIKQRGAEIARLQVQDVFSHRELH